jgi:hypothetical protein
MYIFDFVTTLHRITKNQQGSTSPSELWLFLLRSVGSFLSVVEWVDLQKQITDYHPGFPWPMVELHGHCEQS